MDGRTDTGAARARGSAAVGFALALALAGATFGTTSAVAATGAPRAAAYQPHRIYIATWRGCEEVCRAFQDHLVRRGLSVDFLVRSARRDPARLDRMVAQARQLQPDLIATWGTTVTTAFVGRHDAVDPARHITDIPVVFMYVSDPVGAGLTTGPDRSGRPNLAGAHYTVPAASQIRAMQSYRAVDRLAIIYNPAEAHSVGAYQALRHAARDLRIAMIARPLGLGPDGRPTDGDLALAVNEIAAAEPDFLVFGSSSYLMSNVETLTGAAVDIGVPVFSIGEQVLRRGDGLLGLIATVENIGEVSAFQAERILRDGIAPGDLETAHLTRFLLLVNMRVARQLRLYPPMSMIPLAKFIELGEP